MSFKNKKILVVAAHPDDEVLGCGGAIAKFIKQGASVSILILGTGIASRNQKEAEQQAAIKDLKAQAKKAQQLLGVKESFFEDFPDNKFDSVPLLDIIKVIEATKAKVKPEIIFTHHAGDLNIDHQLTNQAVLTACRPVKGESVKEIYSFEVLSSTEWAYPNNFQANLYLDISDSIEQKVKAMAEYKGELRDWPHPRSIEAIKVLAQKRGCEAGLNCAEAFQLIRRIAGE